MAVVIEEFEIVTDPPKPPPPTTGPAAEVEPMTLRPSEIVKVLQVHEERMQRVRAD
jgi:hypothetical protein